MGLIGWAKERAAWGVVSDLLAGGAFSLGLLGSGPEAVAAKKRLADWLKGHREQTLDPVLDAYNDSVRRGVPMLRDPRFWLSVLPLLLALIPQVQAHLPQDGLATIILGGLVPIVTYIHGHLKVQAEEIKERRVTREIQLRTVERDILLRRLGHPQGGGLDQEIG